MHFNRLLAIKVGLSSLFLDLGLLHGIDFGSIPN